MKRFIALAAAATAAVLPTAAFAATEGTLRGEATVPYACDLTVPGTQTMAVSGTTASLSGATIGLSQNGSTDYSVSTLAITEATGADTSGSISVFRSGGSLIVMADGTGNPIDDENTVTGTFSENGTVDYSQIENTQTAMIAGDYALQTTIICSETPEAQP